jgi:hypothetical protein
LLCFGLALAGGSAGRNLAAMELSPDGAGYRVNTRFTRFINVPQLMKIFWQAADMQTARMLDLPRPKLDGEKAAIRNAPATPELRNSCRSSPHARNA